MSKITRKRATTRASRASHLIRLWAIGWAMMLVPVISDPDEATALVIADLKDDNTVTVQAINNQQLNLRIFEFRPLHAVGSPAPPDQVTLELVDEPFDVLTLKAMAKCNFERKLGARRTGGPPALNKKRVICRGVAGVETTSGDEADFVCVVEPTSAFEFTERLESYTGGGDDHVTAGSGADTLAGGTGNDVLLGGPKGDDILGLAPVPYDDGSTPTHDADDIFGEEGYDRIWGGPGGDNLVGGPGTDEICGSDPFASTQGPDQCVDPADRDGANYLYGSEPRDVNLYTGMPFVPPWPAEFDALDCGEGPLDSEVQYDDIDATVHCPNKRSPQIRPVQDPEDRYAIPGDEGYPYVCPPRGRG